MTRRMQEKHRWFTESVRMVCERIGNAQLSLEQTRRDLDFMKTFQGDESKLNSGEMGDEHGSWDFSPGAKSALRPAPVRGQGRQ